MNLRIKRRRFGQLVIASATSTAIANLAGKAVAQLPQLIIYGVRLDAATSSTQDLVNTTPGVVIVPLDIATGKESPAIVVPASAVENRQTTTEIADKAIYSQPRERLTAFTALADGTFIIPSTTSSRKGDHSRLIFVDKKTSKPKKALKTSGFKKRNSTLESLLATKKGDFIGIVSLNGGTPPFNLVAIDQQTGKTAARSDLGLPDLPQNQRISNLAQAPDGTIYATTLGQEGGTNLVKIDLVNRSVVTGEGRIVKLSSLSFNKKPLEDDLLDLTVSPDGQIVALANPKREDTNSLFIVDSKTGEMTLLRKFKVDKITFIPV